MLTTNLVYVYLDAIRSRLYCSCLCIKHCHVIVHLYVTFVLCTNTNSRDFYPQKDKSSVFYGKLSISVYVYEFLEHTFRSLKIKETRQKPAHIKACYYLLLD